MIRIKLLITLLLVSHFTWSQGVFQRSYGGSGSEYGRAVIECSTGGYLIAGSTNSYLNPSSDVYLLRVDELGEYIWGRNIGAPNKIDWGIDLAEDSDGNFIIAGYTDDSPSGSYDALLMKTDSNGSLIWRKTFGGDDWDFIESMALTDIGEIIIVGNKTVDGISKGWMLKTDNDGELMWETLLNSSAQLRLTGVDICEDENIVFTGYSTNSLLDTKTLVTGQITQEGDAVWTSTYPEFGKIETGRCDCGFSNRVFITGTVYYDDDTHESFVRSFDAQNGDPQWMRKLTGLLANGYGVAQRNNGDVFFAGTIDGLGFESPSSSINSFQENGGDIVGNTAVLGGYGIDILYDIKATQDGGFIATGQSNSFGNNYQVHLCKIDSDGNFNNVNTDFLDLTTILDPSVEEGNFKLYPNPASDFIHLEFEKAQNLDYKISTPSGKEIQKGTLNSSELGKIEISQLKGGLYFISFSEKNEILLFSRFIKLP